MSHKTEKQALRDAYRGLVNRFHKKVEKSALPPAEKERRAAQRKRQKPRTMVVESSGRRSWKGETTR